MGQYVYSWITVAVLAVLAEMLLPGGKGGRTSGHVRFLAGICILAALIPTVRESVIRIEELMENKDEWSIPSDDATQNYTARFEEQLSKITKEAWEAQVYDLLRDEFSVPREACLVSATVEKQADGAVTVSRISIRFSGKAVLVSPRQIRSRVEARLSVPCDVSADLSGISKYSACGEGFFSSD